MAQVRTRKRGKTFSYIFEAGKVDGNRKVVEKGGFATRDAAYKAGVAAYNDFVHGNIGITSESISLKNFMTNWLANVVALNVKPTSLQTYQSHFKNQIIPYLGEVKVQDLTPALLDKWIRNLQKAGLSYKTISSLHAFIHHALNYAVYPAKLINSNPAAYIKVPRNAPKNIVKRTIITPERFAELLSKYPFGTPLYIPLLLLYHTGMRLGETLGLSWQDIDFAAKKITLIGKLKCWQARQFENEKQFGESYVYVYCEENGHIERRSKGLPSPEGEKVSLICVHNDGRLVLSNILVKNLRDEGLNAHSFRHTHATQLIEDGATPKGVAGRLGHSNALITQIFTRTTRSNYKRIHLLFSIKICRQVINADNLQTIIN